MNRYFRIEFCGSKKSFNLGLRLFIILPIKRETFGNVAYVQACPFFACPLARTGAAHRQARKLGKIMRFAVLQKPQKVSKVPYLYLNIIEKNS